MTAEIRSAIFGEKGCFSQRTFAKESGSIPMLLHCAQVTAEVLTLFVRDEAEVMVVISVLALFENTTMWVV